MPTELRSPGRRLALASCLVLFLELTFIRWLPAEVRVVAYFPNLVLIASFLGLGAGALRAGRRSLLPLWPAPLALTVIAALLLGRVAFTAESVSEHLWLLYDDLPEGAPVVEGVRTPIVLFFALTTLTFIPLGQLVAEQIQRFAEGSRALLGYSVDLGGSLAGVVLFGLFAGMGAPPVLWFLLVTVLAVFVALPGTRLATGFAAAGLALALLVGSLERASWYSPYYALSTEPVEGLPDVRVRANGSLHQIAADLVREVPGQPDWRRGAVNGYHAPYRMLGRPPGKVLVLGAGTGNDVAVLLDEGAEEIHAVEIDPVLIELGREIHPNDPYASERVTVFTTDARSFLDRTEEEYDLIVFGTLDSMTRLAALSTVRLDNFVYTREALLAGRRRLAPDGGMALFFMVGEPFIHERLVGLMASTFGTLPTVIYGDFSMFNTVLLGGPAFAHLRESRPEVEARYTEYELPALDLPDDDWPYLYLAEPTVNPFYLSLMAILAGLAVLAVFLADRRFLTESVRERTVDWEMALFGAAFLLLETRFVTAMNLLWGATWITSAVVFGAILLTILCATLVTSRRPMRWSRAAPMLVATLLGTYVVEPHVLLGTEGAVRLALSILYVGLPVYFAAVCFALRFSVRADADRAFGWNLLGAVMGGLLEFLGMAVGFSALVLLAVTCYLGAFLLAGRAARVALAGEPVASRAVEAAAAG